MTRARRRGTFFCDENLFLCTRRRACGEPHLFSARDCVIRDYIHLLGGINMNTSRTLHFDPARIARYAEVGLNTAYAGILLARALLHSGPLTIEDSLFIMMGTVIGLMASCAANPACALRWRSQEHGATAASPDEELPYDSCAT